MKLIVGLGNPGKRYRGTRHNVGSEIIEALCEREGAVLKRKWRLKASVGKPTIGGSRLTAAVPRTFMNLSGEAVAALMRWEKCGPEDLLVVSDDVHLPPGRIRIRRNGGSGGHKGLGSIIGHLGSGGFARLRVGVGEGRGGRVGHVLGRFRPGETEALEKAREISLLAIDEIIGNGLEAAMNKFNSDES